MRTVLRLIVSYLALCVLLTMISQFAIPACTSVSKPRDVAIVLGGGSTPDRLTPDTAMRVATGVRLYREGLVERLHMTCGNTLPGTRPGQVMAEAAIRAGVPPSAVTWEGQSLSTLQNALFSRPDLPKGETRIVVTEPFHALRGAASLAWAGRPAAACTTPETSGKAPRMTKVLLREVAAWAVNIPRALAYSLASALGLGEVFPDILLA